jgi:hypothetical protein
VTSSADFTQLCRRVAEVLAEEDVMNLAEGNPDPVGEYASEAAEIVRRMLVPTDLAESSLEDRLPGVVSEVFRVQFEEEIASEQARSIARRIEGLAGD